ncbi:hypothetical protein AB4099_26780 [Bosea sp. 2KB_26]|uniref:hypothetical protein n=1 Tax=Bosea sp. 2KB_26 TaxID=3237475 RepID=UPI003F9002C2
MAKFEMQIDTAHPVLFLADSAPAVSVPPDVSAAFVTAADDCLAFWVLSHVDGASLVTIADESCKADGPKLFSGSINAPSGVVTLTDSSSFRYLNVPVPEGRVSVDLWADNDQNPEWVWVQLGAIRSI